MKNLAKNLFAVILLSSISFTIKAQTNVSGGIYSNITWTKANSPYIVTDTVVVFPGVTLTIEPGVTIKFADATQLEIRQANLISSGTITDSITFTSNSNNPQPGIWSGVYLNSCNNISFNYCNFLYSNYGLPDGGSNANISNSVFNYNITGLSNGCVQWLVDS